MAVIPGSGFNERDVSYLPCYRKGQPPPAAGSPLAAAIDGNGAAMQSKPDIIILGAGAAGLAAARRLSGAGLRLIVLEARNRLGGRIDTRHIASWPSPLERGAEFIHGRPR